MSARFSMKFATALVLGLVLQAAFAHAGMVRFCNQTSRPIYISIGYGDPGTAFVTRGWWDAAPGQCSGYIFRGARGKYYVHMMHAGDEVIAIRSADKTVSLCVSPTKFEDRFREHLTPDNKLDCVAAGLTTRKFSKLETQPDSEDEFALQSDGTLKLKSAVVPPPPAPPAPPPQAVPPPPQAVPPPQAMPAPQATPAPPAVPPPKERVSAPVPVPGASQTPNACKRYPNLC